MEQLISLTDSFNRSSVKLNLAKYDANGAKHEWTDVAVGQIIDIFNDGDDRLFCWRNHWPQDNERDYS